MPKEWKCLEENVVIDDDCGIKPPNVSMRRSTISTMACNVSCVINKRISNHNKDVQWINANAKDMYFD